VAEPVGPPHAPNRLLDFDTLDADHDGRISEDELVDTLGRRYRGGRSSPPPLKE